MKPYNTKQLWMRHIGLMAKSVAANPIVKLAQQSQKEFMKRALLSVATASVFMSSMMGSAQAMWRGDNSQQNSTGHSSAASPQKSQSSAPALGDDGDDPMLSGDDVSPPETSHLSAQEWQSFFDTTVGGPQSPLSLVGLDQSERSPAQPDPSSSFIRTKSSSSLAFVTAGEEEEEEETESSTATTDDDEDYDDDESSAILQSYWQGYVSSLKVDEAFKAPLSSVIFEELDDALNTMDKTLAQFPSGKDYEDYTSSISNSYERFSGLRDDIESHDTIESFIAELERNYGYLNFIRFLKTYKDMKTFLTDLKSDMTSKSVQGYIDFVEKKSKLPFDAYAFQEEISTYRDTLIRLFLDITSFASFCHEHENISVLKDTTSMLGLMIDQEIGMFNRYFSTNDFEQMKKAYDRLQQRDLGTSIKTLLEAKKTLILYQEDPFDWPKLIDDSHLPDNRKNALKSLRFHHIAERIQSFHDYFNQTTLKYTNHVLCFGDVNSFAEHVKTFNSLEDFCENIEKDYKCFLLSNYLKARYQNLENFLKDVRVKQSLSDIVTTIILPNGQLNQMDKASNNEMLDLYEAGLHDACTAIVNAVPKLTNDYLLGFVISNCVNFINSEWQKLNAPTFGEIIGHINSSQISKDIFSVVNGALEAQKDQDASNTPEATSKKAAEKPKKSLTFFGDAMYGKPQSPQDAHNRASGGATGNKIVPDRKYGAASDRLLSERQYEIMSTAKNVVDVKDTSLTDEQKAAIKQRQLEKNRKKQEAQAARNRLKGKK